MVLDSCTIWDGDARNFTRCFKYWFLDVAYPLVLFFASVAYMTWAYVCYRQAKAMAVLDVPDEEGTTFGDPTTVGQRAKDMRFDFKRISADFNRQVLIYRESTTVWDTLLVISEFAVLLFHLYLSANLFSLNGVEAIFVIRLVLYLQLTAVCSLRLIFGNSTFLRRNHDFSIFKHSVLLYHLMLLPNLMDILSVLRQDPIQFTGLFRYTLTTTFADVALLAVVYLMRFQNKTKHDVYHVKHDTRPCQEPVCSIFQTLTFSWTQDLFTFAAEGALNESSLWGLVKNDYAINQVDKFHRLLADHRSGLVHKIFVNFRRLFLYQMMCGIVCSALVFIPSVFLKHFLEYVSNPTELSTPRAWYMIVLMFVMKIFESMLNSFTLYLGKRIDLRLRTLLINEIYSKALSMRLSANGTGSIINLMSSDAYNIGLTVGYLSTLPTSIIMVVLAVSLLYQNLGWSALIGAMVIVVLIPLNYQSAVTIGKYQKEVLHTTDTRVSQLNEVFNNVRAIKNFAWEDKFFQSVMDTRAVEVMNLKRKSWYWSLQSLLSSITPTLVTFGAFFCFTMTEKQTLTTSLAFTSLTLFNLLRQPLIDLAAWSSDMYQAKISLERITTFLDTDDTPKYEILDANMHLPAGKIGFADANFAWPGSEFTLDGLDILFKADKLNVIIGPTGSGKSSLLIALLGEMPLANGGKVFLPGYLPRDLLPAGSSSSGALTESVAYCSQAPWLINDTVKNNVLYHSKYDPVRYRAVIKACGLADDLQLLSEDTEIGESGVVLSGGQKQRLSLARAIYSSSRYVLLDDCLSAVDSHTSLWIYENCLTGELMRGRTCILVSHNVALTMTRADWVVLLEAGRVADQGTVEELAARGRLAADKVFSLHGEGDDAGDQEDVAPVTPDKLVTPEYKAEGSTPLSAYSSYAHAVGGYGTWAVILGLYVASQTVFVSQTFWLRRWTADTGAGTGDPDAGTARALYYVTVYLAIGAAYSLATTARVYFVSLKGLNASSSIFRKVFARVLAAKSRFFDTTPKGRILNRFSKDVQSVDQELIRYGETTVMYLIHCVSTILMISFVTPAFLLFVVFIAGAYHRLGRLYLSLSRELKRLDSITRSPIYSQFQETLAGVVTIRAFGDELRYLGQNLAKIDQNNKAYYYLWIANRWLSVRTDAVGAFILLLAGSFIILNVENLDAGLAGLSLTYAMTFNSFAVWLIRSYVSVEMSMNSVERLEEYACIETEAPYAMPSDASIPRDWPSQGAIKVKNLTLRYSKDLAPVIKDVSFSIEPKERIAIVGRTGAGKSTIISACFRFLEADDGGGLAIDGVDIRRVGLKRLRRSISIIPQEPALFQGTVRSNLDPFDEFTDAQVIDALVSVNLLPSNSKLLHLDLINQQVQENGTNLSQGQKQLICLARALLKNSKILLLDEATSSIDHATDRLIQETIRKSFRDNTIVTIAHRLDSIIDYDKVLVLDKGRAVEFDTPGRLLRDPESLFSKLCANSGQYAALLEKAAP